MVVFVKEARAVWRYICEQPFPFFVNQLPLLILLTFSILGLGKMLESTPNRSKGAFGKTFGESPGENVKILEPKEFLKMQIVFGKCCL